MGAAGTAALLNVPRSLEALLRTLRSEGYHLGDLSEGLLDGEALVAALRAQEDQRAVSKGAAGVEALGAGAAAAMGARAVAADVSSARLKQGLTFPETWGPTEWGPIPFLPDNDSEWTGVGAGPGALVLAAAGGSAGIDRCPASGVSAWPSALNQPSVRSV